MVDIIRRFLFLLLSYFSFIAIVFAQNNQASLDWDFSGDRRPTYDRLWDIGKDFTKVGCSLWPDILYENYALLYPSYRAVMDNDNLRRQWRKALILGSDKNSDSLNYCFYQRLQSKWHKAITPSKDKKIIFCGIRAKNLDKNDEYIADIIEELALYAFNAKPIAVRIMLDNDEQSAKMRLNPDIRYYLQLLFDEIIPKQGELREIANQYLIPDAGRLLSGEKRQFVKKLFLQKDYKSLLNATDPC